MKKIIACALVMAWTLALGAAPAKADEISEQLERGLKLYKAGKVNEALAEVEFATAQMRQKKAEGFAVIFPEAPAGWKADKPESQSMGQAMFGGVISASRAYHKGESQVRVEIMSDSPLIQTLGVVLNNPMMMQGQGLKLARVGDQKALVQQSEDDQAELQMLVDNKVLVRVEASQTPKAGEVVKDFAGKVNLAKLRELTK